MSRAFTPPETLSKEDIRTIADVRRQVWTSGFKGMAFGSLAGYSFHSAAKHVQSRSMQRAKSSTSGSGNYLLSGVTFSKNTAFLAFFVGGAVGAFAFASAAGKSHVHELHHIFEIGKEDRGTKYQKLVLQEQHIAEMKEREERRLQRRESLHESMHHGHGLSDSHGGHWLDEDNITKDRKE